jgi:hypothetical protein
MPSSPRVRCGGCEFQWFGETASHGLRIVGSCPRCSGSLEFLVPEEEVAPSRATPATDRALNTLHPAAVLGMPTSWAR